MNPPKKFFCSILCAAICILGLGLIQSTSRAEDATGTWKWSFTTQNGDIEPILKLKQDGEKLTGTMTIRDLDIEIKDGKITKDGEITFAAVFERDGNKISSKYHGTLKGDSIAGKSETERDGNVRTRDWNPKRVGAPAKASLTDKWKSIITLPDGGTFDMELRLEQSGEKLSGDLKTDDIPEIKLEKGVVHDKDISWTTNTKRDGRAVTSNYKGKWDGDKITGKIDSDYSGENKTYEWEARRVK